MIYDMMCSYWPSISQIASKDSPSNSQPRRCTAQCQSGDADTNLTCELGGAGRWEIPQPETRGFPVKYRGWFL